MQSCKFSKKSIFHQIPSTIPFQNAYIEHKEITAAQGVKIAAKELEKAIAGINMQIATKPDEVEIFKLVFSSI